ncbi:MAG: cytochrome c biogenesis protein CcdA [Bacteroidota bacterium]|nr:cytochrome c biogenesis protein CcdA [Bacteroidota bacterium]
MKNKFNVLGRMSRFISFVVVMLITMQTVNAQILEPVKWHFASKKISDNVVELQFKATLEQHWHLYSQYVPEDGPVATLFVFDENNNIELIDKVVEPKAIEEYDENFKMVVAYFADEVIFTQKVKLLSDKPFSIKGYLEYMCCDDSRCLPPTDVEFDFKMNGGEETSAAIAGDNTALSSDNALDANKSHESKSLWWFFFLSFIAGLAAILTPCVFPMIPMTVTFFMHDEKHKTKGKIQAVIYGLSIIFIYTVVGTVVAVTFGADFANWLSTHWLPNVMFFLIFMIFAASFLGMFEITLPSWMVNKSDKQADKGGYSGAFFMAFTLVLVSFSCTGPLVGAILVESAGGMVLKPIVGMFGFSLAFALPFTMFAFFPSWLSGLPKSGGWLNSVKVILGLIEMALGLKFLSIADQTYHWGILDREVYLAIWIVIFAVLGFYLLGKIKFSHDSDVKFVSVPRLFMSIIVFSFVVYLVPGMFGAPLKALSGYVPPQHTQDFDVNSIVRDNLKIANYNSGNGDNISQCEDAKYSNFLHLPHGLEGYFDYEQALACSKALDKPIFVDFTGHGCVNCREMEANVWSDPRVLKRLREDYIVLALYVDDKTHLPESEWVKSSYDNKVKKTLGKKNADYQITKFNVNAQPYYVLMGQDDILVQPRSYDLDVEEFVQFLDKGVENYKKNKKPNYSF